MNNKGKSIKINPLKEISPCYKCLIRYVGCHDECAGYLDWKQRCISAAHFQNVNDKQDWTRMWLNGETTINNPPTCQIKESDPTGGR